MVQAPSQRNLTTKTAGLPILGLLLMGGCALWESPTESPTVVAPVVIEPIAPPAPKQLLPPLLTNLDWLPPYAQPQPQQAWGFEYDLLPVLRANLALGWVDERTVQRELEWYVRHPDYLQRVFNRAQLYLPHIAAELNARNMPMELALLPIVESAFDPFAYSHGRASGLWQFIPGTGRRFGLKQNWWYDGRRDVLESTRAALDYLSLLHASFDSNWLNAVAAYNSGEGHVARAIRRHKAAGKPVDFWSIRGQLPKETRTYVPKLLAINEILRNPKKYGLSLPVVPNHILFAVVDTGGQLDMTLAAELAGIETAELYTLNPGVNRWATDPEGPHRLLIPIERSEQFRQGLAELGDRQRVKWTRHRIKNGETLGHIADRYGTTTAVLKQINGLRGTVIRAGRHLMVPHAIKSMNSYTLSAEARAARTRNRTRSGTKAEHVVRSGESFWTIAQRFGVSTRQLAAWNAMAPRDTLNVGRRLVVWHNQPTATGAPADPGARTRRLVYTVRSGDSLARISSRFRISVGQLLKWNKISANKYLQPGQRLVMYVDVTRQSG
jgi:membrane-bound lytic murein transglycosylase D